MLGRRLLAPLMAVSVIAVIASAFACYGPTEVTVALSTDLGCADPIQTAIYKGDRGTFSPEAAAETAACTQGNPDSQIGTLVFLPSGDRSGDVSVKAVLTRNKKPTGLCDSDPTDCIIATRSFAFVEHTSRRVPIRLLKTCLGVKCGPGETCGPKGTCISNRVDCSSSSCDLDEQQPGNDGGPPGGDGGLPDDGGGIRDASDLRCLLSNDSDVLIGGVPMPDVAAATSTSLLWAAPSVRKPGGSAVWSIPKVGGTASEITTFDTQQVVALGLTADEPLMGYGSNTQWNVRFAASSTQGGLFGNPPNPPVALIGNGTFFIGSSTNDLRVWDDVDLRFVVKTTNPVANGIQTFARLPGVGSQVIGGGTAGVWLSFPVTNGVGGSSSKIDFKLVSGTPTNALVTASPTQLFAAGKSGNTHSVIEISGNAVATAIKVINDSIGSVSPTSLGADSTHVYGTINNTVVRWPLAAKASETIATEPEPIRHIAVDGSCVYYWVGSSLADGIGSLKVHPKGPRVKPGSGQ
jgi:hypothetical protein